MDRPILVNEFEDMGMSISDDIIDECVIVCHTHKISASDLVGSWIAYCASSQIDSNDLNKERLATLVKSIKEDDKLKANDKKLIENKSNLNESAAHTQSVDSPSSLKSTHGTNIIQIENEFKVSDIIDEDNINEENEFSTTGDVTCNFGLENVNKNDPPVCVEKLGLTKQDLWENFVFGHVNYQKFDEHVQELVNDIVQKNDLKPVTSLSELYCGNNTEITISGSLRLIKKELFLDSLHGFIKLDMSEAEQPIKSLFVNQILVVTGINPNTKVFKVKRFYTDASLPLSNKLPSFSKGNLNLMAAAGPFFTELSPHGKLLKSLIQKSVDMDVQLLILLGPIFDGDFGMQLNRRTSEDIQQCYDEVLEATLKPLFNNPGTQNLKVLMLSSWKDSENYSFYPTPPNTESVLPTMFPNNVYMLSDPSVFSVNDIIFAGNSSDSLMGLHVSAINQTKEELFTKLARQIIWQRCLHPSYIANPNVAVDHLLWLQHCTLQQNTPHIILTSSQLRTFIRVVDGCMVINIGQLVKHNSQKQVLPGTYGHIKIASPRDGIWSTQTNISAEIVHI
ncbi:DNA polymerase alpha subunit B [Rhopalosiphum maidis]|uniref:DNA polymerase alpha subunit B n=1 Tax=Rhopalosiphum maidis TaxID=43146 RepID=UPI000EFDDD61|nr:DNA polymerase alpha subunit B [Rhopalosiphum maidis]